MILAYLAASGLVMGIFFKSFALVISCLLVALASLVSAVKVRGRPRDALGAGEQPNYAASVVLKALDGAGRTGADGLQRFENEAGEADNAPRSGVEKFR